MKVIGELFLRYSPAAVGDSPRRGTHLRPVRLGLRLGLGPFRRFRRFGLCFLRGGFLGRARMFVAQRLVVSRRLQGRDLRRWPIPAP